MKLCALILAVALVGCSTPRPRKSMAKTVEPKPMTLIWDHDGPAGMVLFDVISTADFSNWSTNWTTNLFLPVDASDGHRFFRVGARWIE